MPTLNNSATTLKITEGNKERKMTCFDIYLSFFTTTPPEGFSMLQFAEMGSLIKKLMPNKDKPKAKVEISELEKQIMLSIVLNPNNTSTLRPTSGTKIEDVLKMSEEMKKAKEQLEKL